MSRRYILQKKLGEGGMGSVYRAVDRLSGDVVAYKQVITQSVDSEDVTAIPNAGESIDLRIALAREFETLATVRHPYIISVNDYGFDEDKQSYFTMSLLDNPRTILEAARGQSLAEQVRLLTQLLQALAYLHRRGIVHCDLKPDNVLVNQDGTVQVVDFGLATLTRKRGDTIDQGDGTSGGTLAYMAPEVLQGVPVSRVSDMYAVGVMAYEMFVGRHPFDLSNMSALIGAVMFDEVDLSVLEKTIQIGKPLSELSIDEIYTIEAENVGAHLIPFLSKLLTKDPDECLDDADEIIAILNDATHQTAPTESIAIRESFLQSATFIGREKEMALLEDALQIAIRGQGSAWLLAGEAGVGKSRVLNELRTSALVGGALVFRGQETREQGNPYMVWNNILQKLILNVEVTDLEASILKTVVPNMASLLDRPVADPPKLDPEQTQERIISAVIALMRKLDRPVLMILEDLHWTWQGLELIQRVNAMVTEIPVLLVGSYRNDERPDLPDELPRMQQLKLERLQPDDVADLAESMIGDAGKDPQIIDLLQRETEGNTFFLVEVIRTLAEEAGKLSGIGSMELPRTVVAGGIQNIIHRRLDRVPETMRGILEVASVMGRQLDLSVLRYLSETTDYLNIDVDELLVTCANLAILDVQDEQWRFSHDKLRDGLLEAQNDEKEVILHKQAASAMETVYAEKIDIYAPRLSYHWRFAKNSDKERHYATLAGNQLLQTSHYEQALEYLTRASELEKQSDAKSLLAYQIGEVYRSLSQYELAATHYKQAIEGEGQATYMALYGLGRTALDKGDTNEAVTLLNQALEAIESIDDPANEAQIYYGLSRANAYLGQLKPATEYAARSLELARSIENQYIESIALFQMGFNSLQLGQFNVAKDYLQQAYTIDHATGYRRGEAFTQMYTGVCDFQLGHYRDGLESVEKALVIARDVGDRRLEMMCITNIAVMYDGLGDYDIAVENNLRAFDISDEIGDKRMVALALSNVSDAYVGLGEYDFAIEYADKAIEAAVNLGDTFGQCWSMIGKSVALLRAQRYTEALPTIAQAVAIATNDEDDELLRRSLSYQSKILLRLQRYDAAVAIAEQAMQHEFPDDMFTAYIIKAIALLHLDRKDEARQTTDELIQLVQSELEITPEKYALHYALALGYAIQLVLAPPAEIMNILWKADDAYTAALNACNTRGVIESAVQYLDDIAPFDAMFLLTQLRVKIDDARGSI